MTTKQLGFLLNRGNTHARVDSAVLDGLDWGNGIEDSVRFADIGGKVHQMHWEGIFFVTEDDIPIPPPAPPEAPPTPPYWTASFWFKYGIGANEFSVSAEVKDQILASLQGPGSEDTILIFNTLRGYKVRLPSKALALSTFEAQS